jgi:tetratricopeptide (TPR) repeat protein
MNSPALIDDFFTAGGTLPADAPSYVERSADEELFQEIMSGEFCYALTPRQMGKSSLMIRMARRLRNERVSSVIIDLTQIGTTKNPEIWYRGILTRIRKQLNLLVDPLAWWDQKGNIPDFQKFFDFFEVALAQVEGRIVIFVDEIDTTLKLDFRDDFFAGIRAIYNERADRREFERLSFVLLGVASPSELVRDRARTPFNIGREITLKPIQREDAQVLANGLEQIYPGFGEKLLDRIFYWTHGHPYLTQKLCQSAVEEKLETCSDHEIDELVLKIFKSGEASQESSVQFVRANILDHPLKKSLLSTYKKVLQGRKIAENKTSFTQNQLKLSGLVGIENGYLDVSNNIYRSIFDVNWVNRNTRTNWPLIVSGVLGIMVLALASVIYYDNVYLPKQASNYRDCAYVPERRVACLADLIQLSPLLSKYDYDHEAREFFFSLPTWKEQKSSFTAQNLNPDDLETVIRGLYTALADTDDSGESTRLLQVMAESLEGMGRSNSNLYIELEHWIRARELVRLNDLSGAMKEYDQALSFNLQNPATLFERAKLFTQQRQYERALRDYDQVIAIALSLAVIEPTESPTPTLTLTPTGTATLSGVPTRTPAILRTATFISAPTIDPTPSIGGTPTIVATISPEPALPELPLDFVPVQSKFYTLGQRKEAVRLQIDKDPNFLEVLKTLAKENYPNLNNLGVFPPATDTPVPQSEISQTDTFTVTPSQTLTPTPTATMTPTFTATNTRIPPTATRKPHPKPTNTTCQPNCP